MTQPSLREYSGIIAQSASHGLAQKGAAAM